MWIRFLSFHGKLDYDQLETCDLEQSIPTQSQCLSPPHICAEAAKVEIRSGISFRARYSNYTGVAVWEAICFDSQLPLVVLQGTITALSFVYYILKPVVFTVLSCCSTLPSTILRIWSTPMACQITRSLASVGRHTLNRKETVRVLEYWWITCRI